jgi:hypothetical protein
VVIDGSGSERFRQQLATYLRRRVNDPTAPSRAIRKVKIQDSKRNNLLQLADMVCGALARSYGGKSDAESYRKIIRHREYSVQFWPK